MSLLEVQGLTVEYSSGGYTIRPLDQLDMELDRGELGIVLGASGSGKSTLLAAVAGMLRPAAGSIRVDGTDVVGLSGPDLTAFRQRQVGVVFQSFNLVTSLSARENVELPLLTAGVSPRAARQRATDLLAAVGLRSETSRRPGQLSGGQQQRVAIARALALDPPLVVADEPTAHLDYIQIEGVLDILRSLVGSQRCVLVATHDERLLPLADKVIEVSPRARPESVVAERRQLAAGEVLFRQGQAGSLVYLVESGVIRLSRERAGGSEEVVRDVGPGGYFGELAPMFGLPRSATARALEPAVVSGLPLSQLPEHAAVRSESGTGRSTSGV
jgi:putative ABC transport system ATP-binding protein